MDNHFLTNTSPASEQLPNHEEKSWKLADILLIFGFSGVVIVAGLFISQFLIKQYLTDLEVGQQNLALSLFALILEGCALVVPIYLVGIRRKKISWSDLGLQSFRSGWFFAAAFLGFLAIPISGFVALIIQILLGRPLENPQLPFLIPAGSSLFGGVMIFILGGLLLPFAEELFFRGLLYNWLRQHWGATAAILSSAFIFAILHGDFAIGGAAFILGIILAWLYERSQSLWPAFIVHAINNGVKIALLYILLATGLLSDFL